MGNNEGLQCGLTNDRDILKREIMKLLDDIPIERVKALYIKALAAKSLM